MRREMELSLGQVEGIDVLVYEPTGAYLNAPKREGVYELTPARALIAEIVRRYGVLGLECTNLEVQKLAWFLQRAIQRLSLANPLNLSFTANKYGPYADQLRHLLNSLDGSYLHCEKRLADAKALEPIWFEPSKREAVTSFLASEAALPYVPALEQTAELIDGFESPLGMELLATVDWLVHVDKCPPTLEGVKAGLERWPGGVSAARRKVKLFDDRLLTMALHRLSAAA